MFNILSPIPVNLQCPLFKLISTLLLLTSVYSTDLLSGIGYFQSSLSSSWITNSSSNTNQTYTVGTDGVSSYLYIEKPATTNTTAVNDWYDSIYTTISDPKPKHISFYFSSTGTDIEATNLRLKNKTTGLTVVSFRSGRAGFVRVNDNQVIASYNTTVSSLSGNVMWNKGDLVIDWGNSLVAVYVNNTNLGTVNFYHSTATSVDTLQLYTLGYGGAGFFTNISVCDTLCTGFVQSSAERLAVVFAIIAAFMFTLLL